VAGPLPKNSGTVPSSLIGKRLTRPLAFAPWRSPGGLAALAGAALALLIVVSAGAWLWSRAHPVAGPRSRRPAPAATPTVPPGAAVPAPPAAIIPPGRSRLRVPILEYHYVRVNPNPRDRVGFGLSVTPTAFAQQMDWLASHGYHTVTVADVRDYFSEGRPLPAKAVVLAFDDGYQDFYATALPILRAHGFTAVAYVVPGFFGRRDYMTKAELRALDRDGVEVGSHTVDHVDLTRLDPASRQIELVASRSVLEQLLGHPVVDFCYPSGRFNPAVIAAVQKAGYQSATTELPGDTVAWSDRFTWERIRVSGGESLPRFVAQLGPPEPWVVTPAASPLPPASPSPPAPPEPMASGGVSGR
jgi:peptidoglycan/xylan/chitin deacetylase (PgdA/CDA1 family)